MVGTAGSLPRQDSLLRRLQQQPPGQERVYTLYEYGESLLPDNIPLANKYMMDGLTLSIQLGSKKGIADFTGYYLHIQQLRGDNLAALFMLHHALKVYASIADTAGLIAANNKLGNIYLRIDNHVAAANHFNTTRLLAACRNDSFLLYSIQNELAAIHISDGQHKEGFREAWSAWRYFARNHINRGMASALLNMGDATSRLQMPETAALFFDAVIQIGRRTGDSTYVLDALLHHGESLAAGGFSAQALKQYAQAYDISQHYPVPDYLLSIQAGYANALFQTGHYTAAASMIQQAIGLSKLYVAGDELQHAFLAASEIAQALGKPAAALQWRKEYEHVHDSLRNLNTGSIVQQLQLQYNIEKNDHLITHASLLAAQENILFQRYNLWGIIIIVILTIIITGLLFYRWKLIQQARLKLMQLQAEEHNSNIRLLSAMIAGEEQARIFLSKALHENVGSMISAAKAEILALQAGQAALPGPGAYHETMDMLDNAAVEVRKTAQMLMPEILSRQGLAAALGFYCRNFQHSRKLSFTYYCSGESQRYKASYELSVYRIVQELISQILRHSRATAAQMQLTLQPGSVTISLEDNGIGFQHQPSLQDAVCYRNLLLRIKAFYGVFSLDTSRERGTSVYITFQVNDSYVIV
ncbi:hypothetical protein ACE38W_08835 [Chitinophaga sp. Hz27]|uniref:hypothetical protein n=1 Tax=Chitinophaga sp. Hz27 TaxID=3347169 RepID=UPI0035DDB4FB